MNHNHTMDEMSDSEKAHKIEMLRQMVLQAEKTMQSAKAMLLQLEGKKKTGRKRKLETDEEEGTIVEGTFDGQIMLGTDGKSYPVPANYASKSKLVEGDLLKLTITDDGSFIYKQIGPANRKNALGVVSQDEKGNYFIFSDGKPYKVLLASVTYFKAEPGDEVAIMIPRDIDATWCAIETVLQKGNTFVSTIVAPPAPKVSTPSSRKFPADGALTSWKNDLKDLDAPTEKTATASDDFVDEWTSDIEDLEREIKAQQI